MKIADRLFSRLLTRLTLLRATRHSDLAADLAAAHGADLADTMSDIDRKHRQLKVKIERVQLFVDDYSIDVPGFAQVQHMSGRIDEANEEWQEIRQRGLEATVDYRDYDIADLKRQLADANKTIERQRDDGIARAHGWAANSEELERFHAWALKLSGLQVKGNPSHATVREQVSKNFELLTTSLNELTAKLAANKRGNNMPAETQETICKWTFKTFNECTPERAAGRLVEEMMELLEELGLRGRVVETGDHWREASRVPHERQPLIKELADTIICGYRVADLCGYNLHAEIDRVMQINRGRQWVRDGKGCGYHVKSPTTKLSSISEQVPGAALYRYGDVAQALGKATEEMVDAVAEAVSGPFERVRDVVGFTPRTEVSEVAPAYFDDETETLPARELADLKQRAVDLERWEGLLRDGLERVLRALFGADVAARAVGDIGTDSFEAVMQAVREQAEYAKAWCSGAGGTEATRLRGLSARAELRSIADRIRTGFAGGEHAAADAILRALADLP